MVSDPYERLLVAVAVALRDAAAEVLALLSEPTEGVSVASDALGGVEVAGGCSVDNGDPTEGEGEGAGYRDVPLPGLDGW